MTDPNALKFDGSGLIPVIVQDHVTSEVLMTAWANREAIELMKETGYTHFWSRSRKKMWKKGEESGNVQKIVSIHADCDGDTLLVRAAQTGTACHTGEPSCFHNILYGSAEGTSAVLPMLKRTIASRKNASPDESYTAKLMGDENRMCKKIVEEAGEFVLAVKDKNEDEMAWELADLIYHTMVAIERTELPMEKVFGKLAERMK